MLQLMWVLSFSLHKMTVNIRMNIDWVRTQLKPRLKQVITTPIFLGTVVGYGNLLQGFCLQGFDSLGLHHLTFILRFSIIHFQDAYSNFQAHSHFLLEKANCILLYFRILSAIITLWKCEKADPVNIANLGVAVMELVDISYCEYESYGFKSRRSPLSQLTSLCLRSSKVEQSTDNRQTLDRYHPGVPI